MSILEHSTDDQKMKKLMKLTKAEICTLYISEFNAQNQEDETEKMILQPSPTQQVLHKSMEENNYEGFNADSSLNFGGKDDNRLVEELTDTLDQSTPSRKSLSGRTNEDEIKHLESFIDGMNLKARFDSKEAPNFHIMYERIIFQLQSENQVTF